MTGGFNFRPWTAAERASEHRRQSVEDALLLVSDIEPLEDRVPIGDARFELRWPAAERALADRVAAKLYRRGLASFSRACIRLVLEDFARDPRGTVERLGRQTERV